MSKPEWSEAPVWAMWLAQDFDGDWRFFEEEPCFRDWCGDPYWWVGPGIGKVTASKGEPNDNHRNTLEKRP